jgi:hypothetical protein
MKRIEATVPREFGDIDAWEVPGLIGAELAHHVTPGLEVVQRLQAAGLVTWSEVRSLTDAAEHLQRIAVTSQQITRLAHGRMRQSHERLDLAEVLRQVLAENDRRYGRHGIHIETHLQPVDVVCDPGLLVTLCEIALECAAYDGERVQMWLDTMHWPAQALLTIRSRPHVQDRAVEASHSLHWIYLRRLADAAGVTVQREAEPEFVQITVEFPHTATAASGPAPLDVDVGGHMPAGVAGHHVLLVSQHAETALQVEQVCARLRLVLDQVPDCAQAVRFCEFEIPDMIVLDAAAHDGAFEQLRKHLLRENGSFPCLEIVEQANGIERGTWQDGATRRVSRSEVGQQLQRLLAMELAKLG